MWTPVTAGIYVISVTALDASGTAVNTLIPYTIGNPLTAVSVTSSLASPQPPNTPITFTATATGGTNVQFQYWLYNPIASPAWSQLQAYSSWRAAPGRRCRRATTCSPSPHKMTRPAPRSIR